jgi:hypothetical protein
MAKRGSQARKGRMRDGEGGGEGWTIYCAGEGGEGVMKGC